MQSPSVARDIFFVLDLDRTLLNTSLVFDILQSILKGRGYDSTNRLQATRKKLEANGETFVVFGYIESLLSPRELEEVMAALRNRAKGYDLFNKGAREFLAFLKEHQAHFGILTYGSKRWQQEKLEIAGLKDVPTIIIPNKGKAELINTWYDEDRAIFTVPEGFGAGIYKQLIIIDDKASELTGLLPHAVGLLYRPHDDILLSQAGEVQGDNVHPVQSFKEATDYITDSV